MSQVTKTLMQVAACFSLQVHLGLQDQQCACHGQKELQNEGMKNTLKTQQRRQGSYREGECHGTPPPSVQIPHTEAKELRIEVQSEQSVQHKTVLSSERVNAHNGAQNRDRKLQLGQRIGKIITRGEEWRTIL